ncbi:MAG TPA: hypothetical protein VIG51_10300 [Candidatus Baltobacteraceae bacterium]|jgi:hypothetical protein
MKKSTLLRIAAIALLAAFPLAGCGGGKSSKTTTTTKSMNAPMTQATAGAMAPTTEGASNAAALDCGAVKPVWVNLHSKAYHVLGDPYYGKTKNGKYMCPSAATAAGYHAAGAGASHHKHGSSMMTGTPEPMAT